MSYRSSLIIFRVIDRAFGTGPSLPVSSCNDWPILHDWLFIWSCRPPLCNWVAISTLFVNHFGQVINLTKQVCRASISKVKAFRDDFTLPLNRGTSLPQNTPLKLFIHQDVCITCQCMVWSCCGQGILLLTNLLT